MKKTTKIVLMSVVVLCLCVSMIAGATFALFTSESQIDISVTSGKVDVTASISGLQTYSYTLQSDGNYGSTEMAPGKFVSGTAELSADGHTLTLDKIVPGDKAVITIKIVNASTVAVKYQIAVDFGDSDPQFLKALAITTGVDGELVSGGFSSAKLSKWHALEVGSEDIVQTVTIELPYDYSDVFGSPESIQDKTCNMSITVTAVQGNANVTDPQAGAPDGSTLAINDPAEFALFAEQVNAGESFSDKTIVLACDIDFSSVEDWTPIGDSYNALEETGNCFRGVFDGGNKTISNLKIVADSTGVAYGLFGYVVGGSIKNLTIRNSEIESTLKNNNGWNYVSAVGALCGYQLNSTISNVKVYGAKITGNCMSEVGGIVGVSDDGGIISDCYAEFVVGAGADSNMYSHDMVGGIAGVAENNVTNCYAKVDFTGVIESGGIVGKYNVTTEGVSISNCYAIGTIVGNSNSLLSGGIVGLIVGTKASVTNCFACIDRKSATFATVNSIVGYTETANLTSANFSNNAWGVFKDGTEQNTYSVGGVSFSNDKDNNPFAKKMAESDPELKPSEFTYEDFLKALNP